MGTSAAHSDNPPPKNDALDSQFLVGKPMSAPPQQQKMQGEGALPSHNWPGDHVPPAGMSMGYPVNMLPAQGHGQQQHLLDQLPSVPSQGEQHPMHQLPPVPGPAQRAQDPARQLSDVPRGQHSEHGEKDKEEEQQQLLR